MENNIFYLSIPDDSFRWLFWMTVSDYCSRRLFRMPVSDDYSGLLFRMTISDAYFRCLFQMNFPDDSSEWLFRMPPNDSFGLMFQMNISDACFRWLFRMTVRNSTTDFILATNPCFHGRFLFQPIIRLIGPTTDSFLNGGFLLQSYGSNPPWCTTYAKWLALTERKQFIISLRNIYVDYTIFQLSVRWIINNDYV